MERIDPLLADSRTNWSSNNGVMRNGRDTNENRHNGTPLQPNSLPIATPTPKPLPIAPPSLLISEFLYDAITSSTSGDEFVEVCNALAGPVDLTGFKVGEEETLGKGEGIYLLPDGHVLAQDECLVIAKKRRSVRRPFWLLPRLRIGGLRG